MLFDALKAMFWMEVQTYNSVLLWQNIDTAIKPLLIAHVS